MQKLIDGGRIVQWRADCGRVFLECCANGYLLCTVYIVQSLV